MVSSAIYKTCTSQFFKRVRGVLSKFHNKPYYCVLIIYLKMFETIVVLTYVRIERTVFLLCYITLYNAKGLKLSLNYACFASLA